MSLSARLALMFGLVSLIIMGTIGLFLYQTLERELARRDDQTLAGRLERMESLLAGASSVSALRTQPQLYANMLGNTQNVLWVLDSSGNSLIEINPPGLPVPSPATTDTIQFSTGRDSFLYRLASYNAEINGQPLTLIAGKVLTERGTMLASYRTTLWWALFLAAAISAFTGWLISRRGLKPVRLLSERVAAIDVRTLDTRLNEFRQYPELRQLTVRLNQMIGRLEEGFLQLSRFSEDLAHEMRTPLNNLIGQSQQCLSKPRGIEQYEALLLSNLEEHERLSRMINSMLFLARAEQASQTLNREPVELDPMIERLIDYFSDTAEEAAVALSASVSGEIMAAPDLLQRALANLVDNAIRHTPANGFIRISSARNSNHDRVDVFNSGDPIATEHLPRLFERFYRCDASRNNQSETGGLGLAIVASIMTAHGGKSEVRNRDDGVLVTLYFPCNYQNPPLTSGVE